MTQAKRRECRLGWLTWLVMAAGIGTDLALTGWTLNPGRTVVLIFCLIFFAVLMARLFCAMRTRDHRRRLPGLLALGLALWAGQSAALQIGQRPDPGMRLSPGELAYLACYVVIAVYLLFDVDRRPTRALASWLDTLIICAGAASAAGLLLSLPIVTRDTAGVELLVALLYPVLDVVLGLLVLGQIALRVRAAGRNSAGFLLGFGLLAVADSSFVDNVVQGSSGSSVLDILLWGAGFALIVSAACRTQAADDGPATANVSGTLVVVAAVAALAVLIVRPARMGELGVLPALLTLLAAGLRLIVALHDAQGVAEALRLSLTDDLTLLPNRRALQARLQQRLGDGSPMALMLMDLDGFKDINDTLGHAHGDVVLQTAARRMRTAVHRDVMIARLGGDEFAMIVPSAEELDLLEIAGQALTAVRRPMTADGIELRIDASVGIAIATPDDRSASALLRRADVAMYQSKADGNGPTIYDPRRDEFSRGRLQANEDLRRGIADGDVQVWYQPQVDATTQQVIGLEALLRWRHPTTGLLTPAAFLPTARQAGLMPVLSEALIELVVRDVRGWRERGLALPRLAVNCAPPELLSGIFVRQLTDAIEQNGLAPDRFVVEVTEDSLLADPERAHAIIRDVRILGLQTSIDDYGTGFSSLAYLRDLPVDELKIDRSFISAILSDERTRMIVESTVSMAHALDLRIVAEGVEDVNTSAMLIAMGVDVMQGYYFAAPMPATHVPSWLARWAETKDLTRIADDIDMRWDGA